MVVGRINMRRDVDSIKQFVLTGESELRDSTDNRADALRLLKTGCRSPRQQARAEASRRPPKPTRPSGHHRRATVEEYRRRIAAKQKQHERDQWKYKPEARTIVHEAGHAVVAYGLAGPDALGPRGCFAVDFVVNDAGSVGAVSVNHDAFTDPIDAIAVSLAGAVAEEETLGGASKLSSSDYELAVETVRGLEGWTDSPETSTAWHRASARARRIIRNNQELINNFAGHLSLEGILDRGAMLAILRNGSKEK